MIMLTKYSAVVFLLSSCFRFVAPIRCYDCNSMNNSMCLEPKQYDEDTLKRFLPTVNCEEGIFTAGHHGFFCRKIVQSILHKGYEPDVRVTRSCGWIRHHRECYKADNEDHLETVCQCFSDDCNAGSSVKYTLATVALAQSILGLMFIL